MKRIEINNFFDNFPIEPELQMTWLEECYRNFPASYLVAFFYLKILQEKKPQQYEVLKSKLLLSIPNRKEFHASKLEYFPAFTPMDENKDEIAVLAAQLQRDIPKITFDPKKHNAEVNMAESGEMETIDFISETLAMIYASQGYTGKAIQMLKKLMVQYPEKNAYFAALIENVKMSITQNQNVEENNH